MGARDLYCFLRDHVEGSDGEDVNLDPCVIDVVDRAGNPFNHVFLQQHDDGSYKLVLRYIPPRRKRPGDPLVASV
jgi:hypothetical protein